MAAALPLASRRIAVVRHTGEHQPAYEVGPLQGELDRAQRTGVEAKDIDLLHRALRDRTLLSIRLLRGGRGRHDALSASATSAALGTPSRS